MAEESGNIQWGRMGPRWWLESLFRLVAFVALLGSGLYLLNFLSGDPPFWLKAVAVFFGITIALPFLPSLPTEGEEELQFSLREAALGSGLTALVIAGALVLVSALAAAFFVGMPVVSQGPSG